MLNGNIGINTDFLRHNFLLKAGTGVMKSVMGELTDPSNRADGFALIPIVWATGTTLGYGRYRFGLHFLAYSQTKSSPLMGGGLSRPHERFPSVFGGSFWRKYPYFLPCLAAAGFVFAAFLIALVLFKEVHSFFTQYESDVYMCHQTLHTENIIEPTSSRLDSNQLPPSAHEQIVIASHIRPSRIREGPVPIRDLLVFPILISVTNYVALAFLNISLNALQPLFFAMPVDIGGLGLSPPTIGYILGACGAASGVFQVFFFARIVRRFGVKNIFFAGMSAFLPIFALFPIMSILTQRVGFSHIIWFLLASLLALSAVMDMAYGEYYFEYEIM